MPGLVRKEMKSYYLTHFQHVVIRCLQLDDYMSIRPFCCETRGFVIRIIS